MASARSTRKKVPNPGKKKQKEGFISKIVTGAFRIALPKMFK